VDGEPAAARADLADKGAFADLQGIHDLIGLVPLLAIRPLGLRGGEGAKRAERRKGRKEEQRQQQQKTQLHFFALTIGNYPFDETGLYNLKRLIPKRLLE